MDKDGRPGRPNTKEAPQLSDEVWSIINLCWDAAPTNRPTADAVCNKLNNTLSNYPLAIVSDCLTYRSPQKMSAQSLPLEDVEPKMCPVSPAVSTHHIRPGFSGEVLSRFLRHGMKTLPMVQELLRLDKSRESRKHHVHCPIL